MLKKLKAVDTEFYYRLYPDVSASKLSAYEHYVRFGWKEGRQPHPDFDGERYLYLNPDVAQRVQPTDSLVSAWSLGGSAWGYGA